MPIIEQVCPSCGAPLTLNGTRCAFCHVPLIVSSSGQVGQPASTMLDPDAPFSMLVEDVFSIKGRGTVVTGRVGAGSVCVGDKLVIDGPTGSRRATCKGIEMFRKQMDVAVAGNNVGLLLDGVDKSTVASGDWLRADTH